MKKVTITDIATLVGVSKATVSYYLNGNTQKMSLATQEKIRLAIEDTGFKPSKIARSLVTKDTKTIGVVIADITNPFITQVMKGIHDTCTKLGYSVNFTNSDNDPKIEKENIDRLYQQNVSGIIIDTVDANSQLITSLSYRKTVMVDRQAKKPTLDTVVSNNKESTKDFIRMMKDRGYEDIYFVTFPIKNISTRELRYEGFKEIMGTRGDRLIVLGESDIEARIREILTNSSKKVAFFTMNGPTLLSFMQILNQIEFTYPDDFGLGSYEDLDWMEVLNPNVSCIRQDSYGIGVKAAEHLINKLTSDDSDQQPELIVVPSKSVLRHSF